MKSSTREVKLTGPVCVGLVGPVNRPLSAEEIADYTRLAEGPILLFEHLPHPDQEEVRIAKLRKVSGVLRAYLEGGSLLPSPTDILLIPGWGWHKIIRMQYPWKGKPATLDLEPYTPSATQEEQSL